MKKKFQKFFKNFFNFFQFFGRPLHTKRFFCTFLPKNNLYLYTLRVTCPFDPPKMIFLKASVTNLLLMCPPQLEDTLLFCSWLIPSSCWWVIPCHLHILLPYVAKCLPQFDNLLNTLIETQNKAQSSLPKLTSNLVHSKVSVCLPKSQTIVT